MILNGLKQREIEHCSKINEVEMLECFVRWFQRICDDKYTACCQFPLNSSIFFRCFSSSVEKKNAFHWELEETLRKFEDYSKKPTTGWCVVFIVFKFKVQFFFFSCCSDPSIKKGEKMNKTNQKKRDCVRKKKKRKEKRILLPFYDFSLVKITIRPLRRRHCCHRQCDTCLSK